ncbi:hypothetical protein C2E44_01490 [Enterobacter ludwigii]|nr:hypothetical protein C2E44_01490 [Enterobacter ludwigii]
MLIHLMSFNLNQLYDSLQGLFLIINSFHIDAMNCVFCRAGVALRKTSKSQENSHEKGRDCRFRLAGNAAGDVIGRKRLAGDRKQNHGGWG